MDQETIVEVGIEQDQRLYVRPATRKFPYIYREAMEVHWDVEAEILWSPKRGDWSYERWFQQIFTAAKEQGVSLTLNDQTKWTNISDDLKLEIIKAVS